MTGSPLAPIIIPIVVTTALAIWLIMVYYAGSHPRWRSQARKPVIAHPAGNRHRLTAGHAHR
jgi:hypothetical protein